ncbi:hypothetical protein K490DRAFT_63208 [Saccharata proteae CBS 121410]|uniref:Uncharacterized protein n=1 Tax=Saccharata proteae CBS 121410 TaxID=1314787 RepID=A0A9P4HYT5_9PEZI|nr:hypothetical protein K490DRAFT_63208 [Saccharata proteae CBS 121410]
MTRQDTKRKQLAKKRKRQNQAITEDGAPYNKRSRPENWSALQAGPPPPRPRASAEPQDRGHESQNRSASPSDLDSSDSGCISEDDPQESTPKKAMAAEKDADALKYIPKDDRGRQKPCVNQTYGQATWFPGLDDGGNGSGEEDEAMEYLRSVRDEASKVPHVLTAHGDDYDDTYDIGDTRGYYQDGAYTAAPTIGPELPADWDLEDEGEDDADENGNPKPRRAIDPQEAYNTVLGARYRRHREVLQRDPPADAIAALSPTQCIHFPYRNHFAEKKAKKEFLRCFKEQMPHPAQIASMDSYTVLSLLGLITTELKRNQNISMRLSTWTWSLLGRLGDFSTLTSEDVCIVRELAKRAIWVRCGYLGKDIAEQTAAFGDSTTDSDEDWSTFTEKQKESIMSFQGNAQSSHSSSTQSASAQATSPQAPSTKPSKPNTSNASPRKKKEQDAALDAEDARLAMQSARDSLLGRVRASAPSKPSMSKLEFYAKLEAGEMTLDIGAEAGLESDAEMADAAASALEGKDAGVVVGEKDVQMDGHKDAQQDGQKDDPNDVQKDVEMDGPTDAKVSAKESTKSNDRMETKEDGALSPEDEKLPNANTCATIHMIITIVGETFGQRDLLEFREIWGEAEQL